MTPMDIAKIHFIDEKIEEIRSYTTEYNSRNYDDDLKEYYDEFVEPLAEYYDCSYSSSYEYLKALVHYSLDHSPSHKIAEKFISILHNTRSLFEDFGILTIQENQHLMKHLLFTQTEDFNEDTDEWSPNDQRIRFDVRTVVPN